MAHIEETEQEYKKAVTRRHLLLKGTGIAVAAAAVGTGATIFALERSRYQAGGVSPTSQPMPITNGRATTYRLTREDGPGSINRTDLRWNVYGADLGHTLLHRNTLYMVFGDTFGGPAADPFNSQTHDDWRSNTMAWIEKTANPLHGLSFGGMITDKPGHAKELLSSVKLSGNEITVIPTYGVSVEPRMFLHYMSVREWGTPGHWTLNYSGLAYSDDDGQSWTKDQQMTWPGESNFGQVAIVEQEGYLYFFGIPGGRYGSVQLARVEPRAILDKTAYHYWTGDSWRANDPGAAATIVPAPVGELSVRWNSYYKKWLMMYLNDPVARIVLRTADNLTGPWSAEQIIVTGQQFPQLYAPYITPLWNDGPDIFYTMSLYGPYCVYVMQTRIS